MLTEQHLRRAEANRITAVASKDAAVAKRNEIVRGLLKQGWTMQRVADVLGVKKQYVSEINKKG